MLFCYRALSEEQPGMEDTEALRAERPGLLKLAYLTETKQIVGVSVPKKPDVDAEEERHLSSFYGMLGIPVCPEVDLDAGAPSAILGAQALGFAGIRDYALDMREKGVPLAFSEAFLRKTGLSAGPDDPVIAPGADNWSLMDMDAEALNALGSVPPGKRNARWYFLSALAQSGLHNNAQAMEYARQAASMEPGNMQYQQLLSQLQGGGSWYSQQGQEYGRRTGSMNSVCTTILMLNLCCACCGGGRMMYYPMFCCI